MTDHSFPLFEFDSQRVVPTGSRFNISLSDRFDPVIHQLTSTFDREFPGFELVVGIIPLKRKNGASAFWGSTSRSQPDKVHFFIEIDESLLSAEHEEKIAHELLHGVVKLNGVSTPLGIPGAATPEQQVADELTSTSHHTWVFPTLVKFGYENEQETSYVQAAEGELEKLKTADFSTANYRGKGPGPVWLALWYFNFKLITPDLYDAVLSTIKRKARSVHKNLKEVERGWNEVENGKHNSEFSKIARFQFQLHKRLMLGPHVSFRNHQEWKAWISTPQ